MKVVMNEFLKYLRDKNSAKNTIASYERDILRFIKYFKNKEKDTYFLTTEDMQDYLTILEEEGKSNSTISRVTASIKAYYKFLSTKNLVEKNPAKNIKSYKVEKKELSILTKSEIQKLLNEATCEDLKGKRDEAMLQLLYATGMRVTELISLKIADVNLSAGKIKIIKAGTTRYIVLNNSTVRYVKHYIKEIRPLLCKIDTDETLFLNSNGKKLTRQGFWKILKKYKNSANIEKELTPHTLRHSFAVHNLSDGMDIKKLQEILGHTDVATTMMYNEFIEDNSITDEINEFNSDINLV